MSRTRRAAISATSGAILLALSAAALRHGRSSTPVSAPIPSLAKIEDIEYDFFGESRGLPNRLGCRIPKEHHGFVMQCLSPSEPSEGAARMVRGLPLVGELRILGTNGRVMRVTFVDAGKNPLCFSVDGVAYLRGGKDYLHYRRDHLDYYGIDEEAIDEALAFSHKLRDFSSSTGKDSRADFTFTVPVYDGR